MEKMDLNFVWILLSCGWYVTDISTIMLELHCCNLRYETSLVTVTCQGGFFLFIYTDGMERDSFVFYRSFFDCMMNLSLEDRDNLWITICEYALNWVEPSLDGYLLSMFNLIRPQIDANNKKYLDWCKGWRPRKSWGNSQKPLNNHSITKPYPNDNDNVNDNVNENDTSVWESKIITSTSDGVVAPYQPSTRIIFSTDDMRDFAPYLDEFRNYWEETDSKGKPKRKKQKTWDTHRRLMTWKKNADTNFGRNKPTLPMDELRQAAVQYYMFRWHEDLQKPYKEYLEKYGVLDKWKELASDIVGAGFIK